LFRFEREKYELEKQSFEQERSSLLTALAKERSQLLADKERFIEEADRLRRDLLNQQQCLARHEIWHTHMAPNFSIMSITNGHCFFEGLE
jgi:hypothetical protein